MGRRGGLIAGACLAVMSGTTLAYGLEGQAFFRFSDTFGQYLRDTFKIDFVDQDGVLLGGTVTSAPAMIRIPNGMQVTVDQGEIRFCEDDACARTGGWSAGVSPTDKGYVQVRRPGPTSAGEIVTSKVGVAGLTADFSARGATPKFQPIASRSAEPGALVESDLSTFTGWVSTSVTVEGGEYRVCAKNGSCGSYTSASGRISDGDQIQVRATAGSFSERRTVKVTAGGATTDFTAETRAYDSTPDAWSFPSLTDAEPGAYAVSQAIAIGGHDGVDVSISGHPSSSYRICAQADCADKGNGGWTTAAGRVERGGRIQVRVAPADFDEVATATLQVGTTSGTFVATARTHDDVPAGIPMGEGGEAPTQPGDLGTLRVADAEPASTTSTPEAHLDGFDDAPISISGPGASYSLNGSPFTTSPGTAKRGDRLVVRLVAGTFSEVRETKLTIGGGTATYVLTTRTKDVSPDAFPLGTGPVDVQPGSVSLSTIATLSGFDGGTVTVSGPGAEYRVCKQSNCSDGTFGTGASNVLSGDRIQVRLTAGTFSETRTATVAIGSTTSSWSSTVRAKDVSPDAMTFAATSSVEPGSATTSGQVTLTGFDDAPISIVGGSYSLNNGAFTTSAGTVKAGDVVRVQAVAGSFSETRTATLTVGDRTGSYSVVTRAKDTTPNSFSFPTSSGLERSTAYTSSIVQITGHDGIDVSISGGSGAGYQICASSNCSDQGSSFTTATTSNVPAGAYVRLRQTTPSTTSTSSATTLRAGTLNVSWSVVTRAGQSCSLPWGGSVGDGGSVTAYQTNTASTDSQCAQYATTRTCNDGSLSGNGSYAFCEVPRNVTVTCTSNIGNTRSITSYAAGQDPLTGTAPSGNGLWVIYRSGRALNCDNAYYGNTAINPSSTPEDSATCQSFGRSGYGSYLHSCYYN